MKIYKKAETLKNRIKQTNLSPVGFVPTMGALHNGHLSLVQNAVSQCPVVVVSIYVNPEQFNEKEDLKCYPRTTESDLNLLKSTLRKNDMVFIPDDKEIYPAKDNRVFSFGNLDNVMEAKFRRGHFTGVARVITRLFDIVTPDIAYFGQKDFQQLAVIKKLVRQTGRKIRIASNPTVRENDGLAMSSRNMLLEKEHRKNARIIYCSLLNASKMISDHNIEDIRNYVRNSIEKMPGFKIEYFEIVDDEELIPVSEKNEMKENKSYYGCIAVRAGKIRLIDNIEIHAL